jgi:outer membrane protein assembly factor BamB
MRRVVRCLGIVGLIVVSAGCWPAPGQGPDRQAHNSLEAAITPATVDQLSVRWTASPDSGAVGDPIVSNAGVHFTAGESLYAINRSTGIRLWSKPNPDPGLPFDMGQAFADGSRLLVGSGFGNLGGHWTTEWIDAATGATLSTPAGGLVDGLRGSTVLLDSYGFGTNTPIAIFIGIADVDDPSAGWSGTIDVLSPGQGFASPMTLGTERAYQGGPGLMPQPGGNPTRANGVRAYPVATPGEPCPTATFLTCPMWSTPVDGSSATSPVLASDESTVYVGTGAGTLYALDAATGAVQWTAAVGAAVTDAPALAGGNLYVPTADGDLVVLAAGGCGAATCSPLWQAATGSSISVQPAVAGGVVFTGSGDGTVAAFDAAGCGAATCPSLWTSDVGSAVTGAPAVSAGRLYVGTAGFLYAYGLP